jgi:hypothetical protein
MSEQRRGRVGNVRVGARAPGTLGAWNSVCIPLGSCPTVRAMHDERGAARSEEGGMASIKTVEAGAPFAALGLDPRLVETLADLGYEEPTPICIRLSLPHPS